MRLLILFLCICSFSYSQTGGNYYIYENDSSTWNRSQTLLPSDNVNDTIYHNGFVGINKTTPLYRLDVNGATFINDSVVYTNIQNSNNVEALNIKHFSLNSTRTGALHIVTNITAGSNTMVDFDIEAYNYSNEASWSGKIGFYTYGTTANPLWTNYCAIGCRNLNVRAYSNVLGKVVVVIGDSLQSWSYPRVTITRARVSHVGASAEFLRNWSIQIINKNVNATNYTFLSPLFASGITPKYIYSLPAVSNLDSIQPNTGVEYNAIGGTQGVGIGYNGIYRSGSNTNQDMFFRTAGNGNYYFQFPYTNSGSTFWRLHNKQNNNQVLYQRYYFGTTSTEWFRESYLIQDTSNTFKKSQISWIMRFGNNILASPMSIETNRVDSTLYPYLYMNNRVQNRRIVLYDASTLSDPQFYGFGINSSTLGIKLRPLHSIGFALLHLQQLVIP